MEEEIAITRRIKTECSTGGLGLVARARNLDPVWWFVPLFVAYVAYSLLVPQFGGSRDDEGAYLHYAEQLTHGHYADDSRADLYLWRGPGLPLLLAPFVAVDAPLQIPRLIPPLLLFTGVVLFYRLLRLRLSERASLIGALGLGLYWPFLRVLGFVHTEPVTIFLVVLALYFWTQRSGGGGTRTVIGAGLALGSLALTHLEYGYVLTACLLIAVGVWLKDRGRPARDAAAVCAVGLALCLPWLAYTYVETEKVFYWSNAGSLSLYWMTSPNPEDLGDPHVAGDVFENPNLAPHRPLFRRLAKMHPIEADAELRRVARRQLTEHPGRFGRNLLNNLTRLLFNFPFSFTQQSAAPLFYLVPNAVLLIALGVAGFVLARMRQWWRLVVPPAVFGVLAFTIHLPVAGYPRYWFPVVPITIWLAVIGISALAARGIQARPRIVKSLRR